MLIIEAQERTVKVVKAVEKTQEKKNFGMQIIVLKGIFLP